MSLTPAEQFSELVRKAEHPIIFLPAYPNKDTIAAGIALSNFFEKMGKSATVAGDQASDRLNELPFLPAPEKLLETLSGSRDFVLSFNTEYNPILSARSEQIGNEFRIFITPEKGSIDPRDFSFIPAKFQFDLAIVIGSPDKESLGKIYEENPDIFYEVPVINIDTKAENEQFGQINLIDLTASSVSEILYETLFAIDKNLIDERISECLLSGIIAATESFQRQNTTPKSLKIASSLIEAGADREKIILSLYKTQSFHLLKLWGRIMSKLQWDEDLRVAYAFATVDDFVQSRTTKEDLPSVLEQIRTHFSSGSYFAVLYPETTTSFGIILKTASGRVPETLGNIPGAKAQGDTIILSMDTTGEEKSDCHAFLETIRGASGT